jgi:protein involved in polysaccharide export with SLBB domain
LDLKRFKLAIDKAYRQYFRGAPDVEVTVQEKRYYVDVRGLVEKPGSYLVKREAALDEVISLAGGLVTTPSGERTVSYVRIDQGSGKAFSIDLNDYFKRGRQSQIVWRGGDRLFFQKEKPDVETDVGAPLDEFAKKVQIIGEVRNPGEISYRKNADGYYYLLKTGGPTQYADIGRVELVRLDLKSGMRESFSSGSVEDLRDLREGDLLIVHAKEESKVTKTLQTIAIITGIVSTVLLGVIAIQSVAGE